MGRKLEICWLSVAAGLTVDDVHQDRRGLHVGGRARILARVVDVDVADQQVVGEGFPVLGELRQTRLRLEAQHLQESCTR